MSTPSEYAKQTYDRLIQAYVVVTGDKPTDGGWMPNDEVCERLQAYEALKGKYAVLRFLQMSVCAHLNRTRKSRTPFFVNSILFAESALEYLKEHRQWLAKMYGDATDPTHFTRRVRADISQTEK